MVLNYRQPQECPLCDAYRRGSFTTVIFQQMLGNRPSKAYLPPIIIDEMYPVRLCLHILPDVLWHDDSRLLVGPPSSAWERSVFTRMFSSMLDFAAKVVGSATCPKLMEFPTIRPEFFSHHFHAISAIMA